ncbi:hypothetical protein [Paenarthrobacter sp. A20]|uniref:hypothetical protein n=1 Tax=Paenarthrobacter sp. A20 TaxID=2817891 RepID=UPI00209DE7EC|nr:hypothetical protein [Paenarthrobacter sp. A20]MCP1412901.1 hypothetical protein [Paenarthrobacter sp. A20]
MAKKSFLLVGTSVIAAGFIAMTALPANAAYSVGLGAVECSQWQPHEVHVESVARGAVHHFTHSAFHGSMTMSAGTSASYMAIDTHHWPRKEAVYGWVSTSSNSSSDIQSATINCQ